MSLAPGPRPLSAWSLAHPGVLSVFHAWSPGSSETQESLHWTSHLTWGLGPVNSLLCRPRADRGWDEEESWQVAVACLSAAAASGAPSPWAALPTQLCSPPARYPGHLGGRRRTGRAGWGPAAPACPRPRRHPGVGSEGWGLCPQSGSPLKCPGPHLHPGHHRWRSLPVRPEPSPLLGRVLGFGSKCSRRTARATVGASGTWKRPALLSTGVGAWREEADSVLKRSSFTWDPHTTLQPPQELSGSKIFRSRSFGFYSINSLAHFSDLALFYFIFPLLWLQTGWRGKRKKEGNPDNLL